MSKDLMNNGIELANEQLDEVAGGTLGSDPRDTAMPPRPPKFPGDLPASEAPN